MSRYVILRHDPASGDARLVHWDFMLEDGAALRTWALAAEPGPHREISATLLPAHRLAYLTYQGPVSGDRGAVQQWDAGSCEWLADTAELVAVRLQGRRLRGMVRLTQHSAGWSLSYAED